MALGATQYDAEHRISAPGTQVAAHFVYTASRG
jgi:hypothetical protein